MNAKDREGLLVQIMQHTDAPYGTCVRWRNTLSRNATSLNRYAELVCSVEMSEKESARIERLDAACERRIRSACDEMDIKVSFDGDPRGYVCRLYFPRKDGNGFEMNTWGGSEAGYGIG